MTDTFVLQELLNDEDVPFRVHNVKIETLLCQHDLPMMFLAHYDSLPDHLKTQKPLTPQLLLQMNTQMTATQACQLLDLPANSITPALHIKITGTSVIVFDDFPLALRLNFTNTAKSSQTLYGKDTETLVAQEAQKFLLCGTVDVLHKNSAKTLISLDNQENSWQIPQNDGYTRLPNAHALATTSLLNELKHRSPQMLAYLERAIVDKVMDSFGQL